MKNSVMITGATSGIGLATAFKAATKDWNLVLTGRRTQRLQEIKIQIHNKHPQLSITTIPFDVSDRQACQNMMEQHRDVLSTVNVLINNAGLARGAEPLQRLDLDDMDEMIDTNLKGLITLTRLMLPTLIQNQPAHIVNLGSVAGRWSYGGGSVYCATKFGVRALSEALRVDLLGQNIRVTNISPGMVETEFSEVRFNNKEKAKQVYQGFMPLTAEDIAEAIIWSLDRPAHVNIQELVIYPTAQAAVDKVHREF